MTTNPYQLLNDGFDRYEAMQHTHLQELQQELMPDIKHMNFERAGLFQELKYALNNLLRHIREEASGKDVFLLENIVERLNKVMDRDNRITEIITEHRDTIAAHMQKVQHGRTAMRGYGQSVSAFTNPI